MLSTLMCLPSLVGMPSPRSTASAWSGWPSVGARGTLGLGGPRAGSPTLPGFPLLSVSVSRTVSASFPECVLQHSRFPDSRHGVWDVTPSFAGWRQPVFSPPHPPHPPAPGAPSRTPLSLQSLCSVLNMRSSVRRSSQCCTAEWGPRGRLLSMQDWITRAPSANVPLSGLRP